MCFAYVSLAYCRFGCQYEILSVQLIDRKDLSGLTYDVSMGREAHPGLCRSLRAPYNHRNIDIGTRDGVMMRGELDTWSVTNGGHGEIG